MHDNQPDPDTLLARVQKEYAVARTSQLHADLKMHDNVG
jgi:hypothetical protein